MLDVLNRKVPPAEQERLTAKKTSDAKSLQVVLVFQGGGALGAYQAGVYQALHETHAEPDWIIGTSIGAINASLIAGNEPENRVDRLEEFWRRMRRQEFWRFAAWPGLSDTTAYWSTRQGHSGVLFDGAARAHPRRACRLQPHRALHAAPHGWSGTSAHQRDALLRQPGNSH